MIKNQISILKIFKLYKILLLILNNFNVLILNHMIEVRRMMCNAKIKSRGLSMTSKLNKYIIKKI